MTQIPDLFGLAKRTRMISLPSSCRFEVVQLWRVEIFERKETPFRYGLSNCTIDILTPAEKVFGPQPFTENTFSGGIWKPTESICGFFPIVIS